MEVIPKVSRKGKTLIFRHIFEHFLTYFSDMESLEMCSPFPRITKGDAKKTFPTVGMWVKVCILKNQWLTIQ